MSKLSIIIPCYNESGNIPFIIDCLRRAIEGSNSIEVLLVDNGSTDNSKDIFKEQLERNNDLNLRLIKVEKNQGYGHGMLAGLREATGSVLSWTHADMQTDPKDVLNAFDLYQESMPDNILVKGKRKSRKPMEWFFSFGMQILSSVALGVYLDDINAQPKMFSREFYEKYLNTKNAPLDFSLDLYVLYQAKKNGYKILETPVDFRDRMHGEAKGGGDADFKTRCKLIKRTFAYIFKLRNTL